MKQLIEVFLIEEPGKTPRSHHLDPDKTVDVLIREIFPDRHEEIDIFIEGEEIARDRHHRVHDSGIRHGHRLHCRPRHHHGHHGHQIPQHPKLFLDTKDGVKEFTAPKNPMSGKELRDLFGVASDYDLWEKVPGKDDIRIDPNAPAVVLTECEHFYTAPSELNPGSF